MAVLDSGELVATWGGERSIDPNMPPIPPAAFMRFYSLENDAVAGEPVLLPPITAAVSEADGSEALKLVLSGFPEGATFSAGALDSDPASSTFGQWVIADAAAIASLEDTPLTMTPPAELHRQLHAGRDRGHDRHGRAYDRRRNRHGVGDATDRDHHTMRRCADALRRPIRPRPSLTTTKAPMPEWSPGMSPRQRH